MPNLNNLKFPKLFHTIGIRLRRYPWLHTKLDPFISRQVIKASIRHWQDDCLAPLTRAYLESDYTKFTWPRMDNSSCALCLYYVYCQNCPLEMSGNSCGENTFRMRNATYIELSSYEKWCKAIASLPNSQEDIIDAINAAEGMIYTLKMLLPREYRVGRYAIAFTEMINR